MATANLSIVRQIPGKETLLKIEFVRCKIFDAFMFKNNLFNFLFEHTLAPFELSSDSNNMFMVKLNETRDVNKLFKNFPNITFEEVQCDAFDPSRI